MAEEMMETALNVRTAKVVESEGRESEKIEMTEGPIGVDVGTCRIVVCRRNGDQILTQSQLNAFFSVPYRKFTRDLLEKNHVNYFMDGDSLVIFGNAAAKFSVMLNAEMRRPMREGLLNPKEIMGQKVIQKILETLVAKPERLGESVCINLPAVMEGEEHRLLYHEAILKTYFRSMGYRVKTINEGLAVVLTELAEKHFSGVGISLGGGMCNVCFSYLSLPVLTFSILKAGDYIDHSVAAVMNMLPTDVRLIKENDLDLSRAPRNRLENALHIFYDEVIYTLLRAFKENLAKSNKLPQVLEPVPIVLGGGTAVPKGFLNQFEKMLTEFTFPIPISGVRLATDPLNATVRGSLIAAMSDETAFGEMD